MKAILGIAAVVATGLAAVYAWASRREEKDIVVDNLHYWGAY